MKALPTRALLPGKRCVEQAENKLVFAGQLVKDAEIRTTPAGIRIARFMLAHHSRREEAGQVREVECRLTVIASGEPLTSRVERCSAGDSLKVTGFLSRAGYRATDGRIELHALHIETVEDNG